MEEGGERWSKPHVASLALHSLFELRSGLTSGAVMLDMDAQNIGQAAGEASSAHRPLYCVLWEECIQTFVLCTVGGMHPDLCLVYCGRNASRPLYCVLWEECIQTFVLCTVGGMHPDLCLVYCGRNASRPLSCVLWEECIQTFVLCTVGGIHPDLCLVYCGGMHPDLCIVYCGRNASRPLSCVLWEECIQTFVLCTVGGMHPGTGIMEADGRQVTTVFTEQPSFHHRHSTNRVSRRVTIIGERAVTPHLAVRLRW